MNKDTVLGMVRHALTFGGGALATNGLASDAEVEQLVGALVTAAGIIWSILDKRAKRKAAATIAATTTPTL